MRTASGPPASPKSPAPNVRGGRRAAIVRSSALLVGLTAFSQVLGFARDASMAAVFGAGSDVDAFLVAQGLMNVVLGLITGAMARSLVPPVSRAVDSGRVDEGHRTVRVALTVTTAVLVVASVVMFVAADTVADILAPGFDPATQRLAVTMTRIVLVATVFIAGTNLLAGAAQAHGRFFWSGVQGIPFNVVMIVVTVTLGGQFGVITLAVGFVVGSAVRLLAQLPAVRQIGLRLRPSFRVRDPGFREVVAMVPPLLVGSAILNVNTMVDRAVGSSQGPGTISSLSYGWRVVTLAEVVVVTAFTTALFPAFSALGTPERRAELRQATDRVLGVVLVLISPVVIVLAVAARPIVVLLFARGNFDSRDVELTSLAVAMYSISLVALAVREVAARTCLAVGDSRTPVLTALAAMVVNVVGDLTLGRWWGVGGLALSTSLSVVLAAVVLSLLTARRHQAVGLLPMLRTTLAVGIAAAVSAGCGWVLLKELPVHHAGDALLALGAIGTACLASYLGVLLLLRVPALAELRESLRDLRFRRTKPDG
ncbi:murein biosynthesis integral membrane protein MurJ [Actinopolymorpha alba]|uniref:murein biosynthesis integral membrane protein MurJ n=1 Tax=Actinopolymorpha alba TaxID=533267 RepID=UPI00036E6ED6|nr:murein biosynthesis integral membrane protein MurJ [Actinopolymorpha alba]